MMPSDESCQNHQQLISHRTVCRLGLTCTTNSGTLKYAQGNNEKQSSKKFAKNAYC